MIAHIVFFEPRTGLSEDERRRFLTAIQTAVREIPEVQRAHIGTILNIGQLPAPIAGQTTYSYAATFEFASPAALDAYLKHAAHALVRELFWKFCAATLIVDADMRPAADCDLDLLVDRPS